MSDKGLNERAAGLTIGALHADDWPAVRQIYLEGIETGKATFETTAPEWAVWDATHRPDCRLAARSAGEVVGWAALSSVSRRAVYSGLAEVSVYVDANHRGIGAGRLLLEALIESAEASGIWTMQSGVFLENKASLSLHERCGFRRVGVREKMARLNGVYRDVVLLERRSRVVEFDGVRDRIGDAGIATAPALDAPLCRRLLRYDDWANRAVAAALSASSEAASLRLLGHIIGTHFLWLERLGSSRSSLAIWPDVQAKEAPRRLDEIRDSWSHYLTTDPTLSSTAHYENSKGQPWASKASDIAMHVIAHGVYHRGQIAGAMRRAGLEPVYADFIHAVRSGQID